jgi:hypothetical protein
MDRSDNPATLESIHRAATAPAGSNRSLVSREELRLALRAVLVHTAQQWPGGVYCSCDRSPFPCRLRRWGERVLLSAGWQQEQIDGIVRQVTEDAPPWLVGIRDGSASAF